MILDAKKLVRARGLEPLILSEPDPKSGASAIPPRAHIDLQVLTIDLLIEPDHCDSVTKMKLSQPRGIVLVQRQVHDGINTPRLWTLATTQFTGSAT